MADKYTQASQSLQSALGSVTTAVHNSKELALQRGRQLFDNLVKERDAARQLVLDKNTPDSLWEVNFNKYAKIENLLNQKLGIAIPGVEAVTPEDRKFGVEMAQIMAADVSREDKIKAAQLLKGKIMASSGIRNREQVDKDFNDMLSVSGLTGEVKEFQEGGNDITAQVDKFGRRTNIASAPNLEAGRLAVDQQNADMRAAEAGQRTKILDLRSKQQIVGILKELDKAPKENLGTWLLSKAPIIGSLFPGIEKEKKTTVIREKLLDALAAEQGLSDGEAPKTDTDVSVEEPKKPGRATVIDSKGKLFSIPEDQVEAFLKSPKGKGFKRGKVSSTTVVGSTRG